MASSIQGNSTFDASIYNNQLTSSQQEQLQLIEELEEGSAQTQGSGLTQPSDSSHF